MILRSILGNIGAILGPFWANLGPSWAILGPSWGHLGASWGFQTPSTNLLAIGVGTQEALLGAPFWDSAFSWGQFGANLAPSWAISGSRCTPQAKISMFHWFLNDFKVNPRPSWGHLGAILGQLGAILGHLGAHFGPWVPSWVPAPIAITFCQLVSGPNKGPLGAILGPLGAFPGHLGASWGHLGPSGGHLGA